MKTGKKQGPSRTGRDSFFPLRWIWNSPFRLQLWSVHGEFASGFTPKRMDGVVFGVGCGCGRTSAEQNQSCPTGLAATEKYSVHRHTSFSARSWTVRLNLNQLMRWTGIRRMDKILSAPSVSSGESAVKAPPAFTHQRFTLQQLPESPPRSGRGSERQCPSL